MRLLCLLLAFACAAKPPGATTPAASGDVAGVADNVVADLPMWEGFARYETPPKIVVLPTENHTKFKVDTQLATTKLVNGLIRVSGEHFDVVDPETWAARPPDAEPMPGMLMLHSEVRSLPADGGDGRPAVQVLMTYRLVESDTARAVWAADFEWTKVKGKEGYEMAATSP